MRHQISFNHQFVLLLVPYSALTLVCLTLIIYFKIPVEKEIGFLVPLIIFAGNYALFVLAKFCKAEFDHDNLYLSRFGTKEIIPLENILYITPNPLPFPFYFFTTYMITIRYTDGGKTQRARFFSQLTNWGTRSIRRIPKLDELKDKVLRKKYPV